MKGFILKAAFFILAGIPLYGADNSIKFSDVLDNKSNQDKIIDNYIKDIKKELSPNQEKEIVSDKIFTGTKTEIKSVQIENLNVEDKDESNRIREFNKIEPVENEMVKFFIQYYTTAGREYLVRSLERMETYYPVVEKYLKKYGLPLEVSLLIIVESGYMPKALSTQGALGLWQLMPLTAKIYGLKINQYIDERMDVEKSSFAAARYLRDLIEAFNGNWPLVLASYNGGGGYINAQIRKQKENDFWVLSKASGFKSETLEYVPRFYALLHILKNPEKYDIKAPFLSSKPSFETLVNPKDLKFCSIADYTGVSENTLRELNPHFKEEIALKNCNLFVPNDMGDLVLGKLNRSFKQDKIALKPETQSESSEIKTVPKKKETPKISYKQASKNKETIVASKTKKQNPIKKLESVSSSNKTKVIAHKVQSGDTLMAISRKYNVNVHDIKKFNSLKTDAIQKGQIIQVKLGGNSGGIPVIAKKTILTYKVQKGDTLYSLSKRFNIGVNRIATYNKIASNQLVTGKTILIPREEG